MNKTQELYSARWVELAVLPPGQSHYWFFDSPRDLHGSVYQATAYPEPSGWQADATPGPQTLAPEPPRVEVTELFVSPLDQCGLESARIHRINVTVTNCGGCWAAYSLWVAAIVPKAVRPMRRCGARGMRTRAAQRRAS